MKKEQDHKSLYLPIIIIILSFLVSWKYLVPKYQTDNAQLASTQDLAGSVETKLAALKAAETELSSASKLVSDTLVAVPSDVDFPNLITELEAISTKNQVVIPSMQVAEDTSGTGSAIKISFGVNGSYANLIALMKSIEKDIRFMNIKSVSLTGSGDKMTIALQIEAYKQPSATSSATNTTQ